MRKCPQKLVLISVLERSAVEDGDEDQQETSLENFHDESRLEGRTDDENFISLMAISHGNLCFEP